MLFAFAGCKLSSDDIEYQKGETATQNRKFDEAVSHFRKLIEKSGKTPLGVKAEKEAARIAHYELKKFPDAIFFYKQVILDSADQTERIEAQRKIADLYFSQTLDYQQAIVEYSRLLELPHDSKQEQAYRLAIARSYFYLNNFFQSQIEIEQILKSNSDKDIRFDALLLKANILLTAKKLDDAVSTLREIIDQYPARAKTENIGLVLAVTYQEQNNFAKAIETLESIKDSYPRRSFIENRIKTLKERQTYLPGARGLKK
jgi:tetratricopeptide (TPR) repeat protein